MIQQTAQQRKQQIERERRLYDNILDVEGQHVNVFAEPNRGILAVHFILKFMPLALVVFDELTALLFQQQYTAQLVVLLIAIQFWVTKNYIGKKMLGYKWFFGEDPYGYERLMFECRANSQLIDPTLPRLFWIIQFMYIVIAGLLFAEALLIIPNAVRIESRKLQMNLIIVVSGMANIFFFYIISDSCIQRQQTLRRQVGIDYVKKLQLGSIVGYYK